MNWENQDYSFSYPNASPLTPNKTPTAAAFPSPSPTLQTPQNNTNNFELHSGWTPTFADEYSVFDATPGRLLNTHQAIIHGQEQEISNQQHSLSAGEETFPSNFSPQFQSNPNPKLPLPPIEAPKKLTTSARAPLSQPAELPAGQSSVGIEKVASKITPRKTRGRLEESPSAQTATPPHTASRGVRRLAAKPTHPSSSMSQSQGFDGGSSGTQHNHVPLLDFSNASMDNYGYPMSAPATAPSYLQGKSFWDTDSSMTGMEMDFGNGNAGIAESSFHKQSNSLDWGRSNEMFQNTSNNPPFDMEASRNSSIAESGVHCKPVNFGHTERHSQSYESNHTSGKDNQFASPARSGVVDPGLIFSFAATSSGFQQEPLMATSESEKPQAVIRQPYQHQIRESQRDQQEEELRRSRPSSQASFHSRDGRASFVSPPGANPRASLQRSTSESSNLKLQSQAQRSIAKIEQSSRSRERRISPVKNQNRTSLTSIPESSGSRADNAPITRTDITFTIDANGRARTETTITLSDKPRKRSASSANSGNWDDSQSESSSDEDIILVPSRNTSFQLPEQRRSSNAARTARFDRSQPKRGRGSSVYSQSSTERSNRAGAGSSQGGGDPESEAETVVEQDERSGDAASALRKVMETRRTSRTSRHIVADATPTRNSRYTTWDGMTPSSNTDQDVDTPSTDRSGTTRCVCGQTESDGQFMIQCESCSKWLHAQCVGINPKKIPHVFICTLCTFTPSARGRLRDGGRSAGNFASSPLTRKSFR